MGSKDRYTVPMYRWSYPCVRGSEHDCNVSQGIVSTGSRSEMRTYTSRCEAGLVTEPGLGICAVAWVSGTNTSRGPIEPRISVMTSYTSTSVRVVIRSRGCCVVGSVFLHILLTN